MTRRMQYTQPAPPGGVFAADAFEAQIGRTVPLTLGGSSLERDCEIVDAVVSEDGSSVMLTVEVDEDAFPSETLAGNGFSIAEG